MFSNFFQILCVFLVQYVVSSRASDSSKIDFGQCLAPNNKEGLCLRLADCKHIYDLVLSDIKNKEFLTQSQCGLDDTQSELPKKVLVCCPNEFCDQASDEEDSVNTPGNILPRAGVCGQVLWNRILGGNKTQIDEFPWMALIKYLKPNNIVEYDCAGSLINHRYVLTAAHCVQNEQTPKNWTITHVRLGEHNLNTEPDCEVGLNNKKDCAPLHMDIPVESIVSHENYIPQADEQFNDIALIRLAKSVTYSSFIKPICLPISEEIKNKNFNDASMEVAGWGATNVSNFSSEKLKASVKVWSLSNCQQRYAQSGRAISDTQLCAGGEHKIDACRGDSGGPLMTIERIGTRQISFAVGVVSYGPKPCGILNWPGVYTKLSSFVPWIQSHIKP